MAYVLPQVQVFQTFRQVPTTVIKNLNAFISGPQYQLFRYGVTAEKALIGLGEYDESTDTTYAYPNQPAGSTIDTSYVKLYMENVWAQYAVITTGDNLNIVSASEPNKVRSASLIFAAGNGYNPTFSRFRTRGVKVGDAIRYSVVDGTAVTHTGTTKVVGFEADQTSAVVAAATLKATNGATQTGDDLTYGIASRVTGAVANTTALLVATTLEGLDSSIKYYPGEYSEGLVSDSYTVTITTAGVKGVARATVSNASGTYLRTGVSIQSTGTDGAIYVGRNVYIDFTLDTDKVFYLGDSFTFEIDAPFTAISASTAVSSGTYVGDQDTTYTVQVTRGGVFNRTVTPIVGLAASGANTLTFATMDWADWTGGDVDDEYVLTCTTGGILGTSRFSLTSQLGDDATGINFLTATTDTALGTKGLIARLSAGTAVAGDSWVIKVNACRAQVRISDTAGIDTGSTVTVTEDGVIDLGVYGAELTFTTNLDTEGGFVTGGGLLEGDVFYVAATAAVDAQIRTLILADDLPAALTSSNDIEAWLYAVQSSVELDSPMVQVPPDYNWEAGASTITVYSGIGVQESTWGSEYLPVYTADMYVEYRALMGTNATSIGFISDITDVETTLGTITPDNPLAQGVYNALSNSGNRGVYYMAVPSDDSTGYERVLDAASLSADVYAFNPLTTDASILNTVEAHINSMSSEENKRWRIGFFSRELPIANGVYTKSSNPAGVEFLATVEDDPSAPGTQYTIVRFTNYTACVADLVAGDKIRINYSTNAWGEITYDEYTVSAVLTNSTVRLVSGPATSVPVAGKTEAWHNYSIDQMATAYAALATGYANRRIYLVFPTQLGAYGTVQSGMFGASAIAGLMSSVPPQQGLTNISINGFDDLPMVYSTFNRTQLNRMAEAGVMIIMQDIPGGAVYVRHQVSTASSEGNLNTRELSITKNLDSVSYYFSGRLAPFIGRYNVTPELLLAIRTVIEDGLLYLGSFTAVGLLGPQVLLDGSQIRGVSEHPTLKDTVVATVDLQLPYPLNVIELHLVV